MSGQEDWFYMMGAERQGPVTFDILKARRRNRVLKDSTLVWTLSFGDEWMRLDEVLNGKRPSQAEEWFYMQGMERKGPFYFDSLKSQLGDGTLKNNTLVWTKSFGDEWRRLDEVVAQVSQGLSDNPSEPQSGSVKSLNEQGESQTSWFSNAAKAAILNGLWLGPLNIFLWFQTERFDDPYYLVQAQLSGISIDEVIGTVIVFEMLLMILSLFVVFTAFALAKAKMNVFTWIIFFVLATVLWNGLSLLFGL